MPKPLLVLAYGNPSRGDDALAPLLLDTLQQQLHHADIEFLTDFQLQIEHALDLQNRELVLFLDASLVAEQAYSFTELHADKDKSYTTHAMSPTAVLEVYQAISHQAPPPCFLIGIKAESFELGESISVQAQANLLQATHFALELLKCADVNFWRQQCTSLIE